MNSILTDLKTTCRAFALGVAIAAGLSACASNPTGGTNFVLMSEAAEIEKGDELHEQMLKDNSIYEDPELQAYVEKVGQKMADISHRPDLDYTFTIIDSAEINAFALPGGHIYVNRGLLTWLTSEAQLAAVLGHEIAHVTARHAVQQQTAARAANVAGVAVSIATILATGVDPSQTTSLVSQAMLSGYGRDMELEADGFGAEYLARAGYDPMAMVEVITVLKNQEDFRKKTGQGGGGYHGTFSTHPRNDTRLREVVSKSEELAQDHESSVDPAEFRRALTGLPIGQTLQSAQRQDRNRYYQTLLGYTIVFPTGWTSEESVTRVSAQAPEGEASLVVEAQRLNGPIKDPRLFIRENLHIEDLQSSEPLSQFGLPGFTGIRPDTGERLAVLYYGPRAFIITGSISEEAGDKADELLLSSIRTFRPIQRNEMALANPVHIEYVQIPGDQRVTYADLVPHTRLSQFAEDQLRLMNADYPGGEPEPGEWVKLAR